MRMRLSILCGATIVVSAIVAWIGYVVLLPRAITYGLGE